MRHNFAVFLLEAVPHIGCCLVDRFRGYRCIADFLDGSIQNLSRVFFVGFHRFSPSLFLTDFFKRTRARNRSTATVPRDVPSICAISELSYPSTCLRTKISAAFGFSSLSASRSQS